METRQEEVFKILGHITVFFATLDFLVTSLMFRLIDYSKAKQKSYINDRTTLKQKFIILKEITEDKVFSVDVLNSIKEFIDEAIDISEKRNRFIHDQWLFGEELLKKGQIARLTFSKLDKGLFYLDQVVHTINELFEFIGKLGSLQKRVGELLNILPVENQTFNAKFLQKNKT